MRLDPEEEPSPTGHPQPQHAPAGARFGLWGPLYSALWLNVTMEAVMVYAGRAPETCLIHPWIQAGIWAAALGLVAGLACHGRIALHDLLLTLTVRDSFLLGLFTLVPVVLPMTMRGPRVFPDGLLWGTPVVLILAVTPALTRRLLAMTLLGGWTAAMRLDGEAGLYLALGFGLTWLIALGATHFAHTGDPHELGGMWPVRKVIGNALLTAIPATLAAWAAWMAWPKAVPRPQSGGRNLPQRMPTRMITRLDAIEREEMIYWGIVTITVTLLGIVVLHYIRKWLLRHGARAIAMKLVPGQVAQVEYQDEEPEVERPRLDGLRGSIVALWSRWAAAAAAAASPRAPGETAAAYAERLAEEKKALKTPEVITTLLEQAHYGKEEPQREDVEAMKRHVMGEIERMKKEAGKK